MPAPALHLRGGRAGEFIPAPVVPEYVSGCVRQPADDGQVFGNETKLVFSRHKWKRCGRHSSTRWVRCELSSDASVRLTKTPTGLLRAGLCPANDRGTASTRATPVRRPGPSPTRGTIPRLRAR